MQVFVALGSNLGPRAETLDRALAELGQRGLEVTLRSSLYSTEPVDCPPQDWFLNAVAGGSSSLTPEALLGACLEVERLLGRVRDVPRGPRTIDLDLLLQGDLVRDDLHLTLPHPRLHERRFVLVPLVEIAPDARHPRLGLTARELLARCPDTSAVVRCA